MNGREREWGRKKGVVGVMEGGDKRSAGREIEIVGRRGERGSEDGEGGGGCGN